MVPDLLELVLLQLGSIEIEGPMDGWLLHVEDSVLEAAEAAPFALAILFIEVAGLGILLTA